MYAFSEDLDLNNPFYSFGGDWKNDLLFHSFLYNLNIL